MVIYIDPVDLLDDTVTMIIILLLDLNLRSNINLSHCERTKLVKVPCVFDLTVSKLNTKIDLLCHLPLSFLSRDLDVWAMVFFTVAESLSRN